MKAIKSRKSRIYPTKEQVDAFMVDINCKRFVWNELLFARNNQWEVKKAGGTPNHFKSSQTLTAMKQLPEFSFLKEANSCVLQKSYLDLDQAYSNFFKSKSGKRKGPAVGQPRYKSKKATIQSATYQLLGERNSYRDIDLNVGFKLPKKIGWINVDLQVIKDADKSHYPKSVTVSVNKLGQWFLSFSYTIETKQPTNINSMVGIDFGIKTFATFSDGVLDNGFKPDPTVIAKLKKLQQKLSRQKRGSNGYKRTRKAFAKLHLKIANQRKDYNHKFTRKVVNENDLIAIETLSISNWSLSTYMNRKARELAISEVMRQLEYKCLHEGKIFIKVSKWLPSSQICQCCGKKTKHKLDERVFTCSHCGYTADRDVNAAQNILDEGLKQYASMGNGIDLNVVEANTGKAGRC